MPDFADIPGWAYLGGAGVLASVAYKFFWPAVRDSLTGQSAQWRSENRYIQQLEDARRQAVVEKREAEQRYEDLFLKYASLEADMRVLKSQLDYLQRKLSQFTGDSNA